MEERLITLVKENTKRDNYEDNNASNLSNIIGLSRNSISSYLNDYFNQGRFVKINTRPVLFLEKSELEKRYNIKINKLMFASLDELDEYAKTHPPGHNPHAHVLLTMRPRNGMIGCSREHFCSRPF